MTRKNYRRKVLVVAYHYPPDGGIGARRTEKFVEILPEFGWQPHILTVRKQYYEYTEERYPDLHLPLPRVTRTRVVPNLSDVFVRVKRAVMRGNTGHNVQSQFPLPPNSKGRSSLWRVILSLLCMPDDKQGWFPCAVVAGLLLRTRFDVIYSSGPPWTGHLIALALHRLSGLPWAADFRDPWSTHLFKPPGSTSWLSEKIEAWLRSQVLRQASALIYNTDRAASEACTIAPDVADKVYTISNGFDMTDVPQFRERPSDEPDRKVLVHAGTLSERRDPTPFLMAVEDLIADCSLDPGKLCIDFTGCNYVESSDYTRLMSRLSDLGCVVQNGLIPRDECLQKLAAADGYIVITEQPTQVPAKLYDYMLLRKPVLVVTESGSATAGVVERTRLGVIASNEDQSSLKAGILRMVELMSHRNCRFAPDEAALADYDINRLTGRLAAVLNSVFEDRRPRCS